MVLAVTLDVSYADIILPSSGCLCCIKRFLVVTVVDGQKLCKLHFPCRPGTEELRNVVREGFEYTFSPW